MVKFIAGYIWTQIQTTLHKMKVLRNIVTICDHVHLENKWVLYRRGLTHDLSKYRWCEAKHFAKSIFDLKGLTYGSEEYIKALEELRPAIKSHYSKNSHHPQYYKNGFSDMSYLDKLELLADWEAATHRHKNGDIFKSIEINQKRFNYSDSDKEWMVSIVKLIV